MKTRKIIQAGILAALASTSLVANATANTFNTIYGTNFGNGSTYNTTFLGDVNATFAAKVGAADGKFTYKAPVSGYEGAGVSPKGAVAPGSETQGEIDHTESIDASFSKDIFITNFKLALLFDGPEFNDVNEVAKITATYFDNSVHTFKFIATGLTTASWDGLGTFTNLSKADSSHAGVWSLTDPFGGNRVKALSFGVLPGLCAGAATSGTCLNQSDYSLLSISAVPEPETYGMMLAGLGLMGFMARRRKSL